MEDEFWSNARAKTSVDRRGRGGDALQQHLLQRAAHARPGVVLLHPLRFHDVLGVPWPSLRARVYRKRKGRAIVSTRERCEMFRTLSEISRDYPGPLCLARSHMLSPSLFFLAHAHTRTYTKNRHEDIYCWWGSRRRCTCLDIDTMTDLTCKRSSVGHSEGLSVPRSSVRFRLNPNNSNSLGFELRRPSNKGTKILLKAIKAIIIIRCIWPTNSHAEQSYVYTNIYIYIYIC